MASRSLLSNVGPRGARGHRRFDREREARHHERHLIARGSQSLVHEAEEIAEAKPLRRLGMDPLADFVADEDDIPRAAADERRQRRALAQDHLVGDADEVILGQGAALAIGHPERHAVDEYRVGPAIQLVERTNQDERFLDRLPVRWPVRAVAPDALGHVAVAGLSGGDEGHARAGHELSHGKTALAAAGPAENQMRQSHGSRILPRRPVMVVRARAGLLALGSSYSPRLPGLTASR